MQTMIPANRTARPEVLTALTIDESTSPPAMRPCRWRVDDEQGVVDADAESDEQHQLVGERRHLEHVAEQADHADGGAERGQGRQDHGSGHGEDGAEDEQQDDRGQDDARALVPPERLAVGLLGDVPGHGDGEVGCWPVRAPGRRSAWPRVRDLGRSAPGRRRSRWCTRSARPSLIWLRPGSGRRARPPGRRAGSVATLASIASIAAWTAGVGHRVALRDVEDDALQVAGELGVRRLQEVEGLGRLGVGQRGSCSGRRSPPSGRASSCPTRATSQNTITAMRWRTHQVARDFTRTTPRRGRKGGTSASRLALDLPAFEEGSAGASAGRSVAARWTGRRGRSRPDLRGGRGRSRSARRRPERPEEPGCQEGDERRAPLRAGRRSAPSSA